MTGDDYVTRPCPHCGGSHPEKMNFCPQTGQPLPPLENACPQCGKALQPTWSHCPACALDLTQPLTVVPPSAEVPTGATGFNWKVGVVVLVILVVILGGSWAIWRTITRENEPVTETSSNLPFIETPTDEFLDVDLNFTVTPDEGDSLVLGASNSPTPTATLTVTPVPPTPTFTLTATPTAIPSDTPTSTPYPTATLPPSYEWTKEVLRDSQRVGYFTSLVIDPQDNLHVSFYQDDSDLVWYANNVSGKWAFEYIMGGSGTGFHLELGLDQKGFAHIGSHIASKKQNPEMRYVHWTGKEWKLFRIYDSYVANTDISMKLDADDLPHMSFLDGYSFNLKYTYYDPARGWDIQTVDAANPQGQSFPLVLDAAGNPHFSYQAAEGGLKYSILLEGAWQRSMVDESNGAGLYSALALDTQEQPHLAYYDGGQQVLKYAYLNGDTWEITTVDKTADVGQFPSIAVGTNGQIYISYYDITNTALKFAHGKDSHWDIYEVDNQGNVGQWNSLALNSQNIPFITYLDYDREDLKIAQAFPVTK